MNNQTRLAVEKSFDGLISVTEIFYTLQGEGPYSGCPAVFVRLAGCNLKCSFCDTFYSVKDVLEVLQVVEIARDCSKTAKLCVVTGGEPLRQAGIGTLVNELGEVFDAVQIETSGSCYQDGLRSQLGDRLTVVCSPKTSKLHKGIISSIDAYKYILRDGFVSKEDGLPIQCPQTLKPLLVARPQENRWGIIPPIYVGPWDEQDVSLNEKNTQAAVRSCLKFGYRLSLQVHKLVNLP